MFRNTTFVISADTEKMRVKMHGYFPKIPCTSVDKPFQLWRSKHEIRAMTDKYMSEIMYTAPSKSTLTTEELVSNSKQHHLSHNSTGVHNDTYYIHLRILWF
jgi:hypothetical protein